MNQSTEDLTTLGQDSPLVRMAAAYRISVPELNERLALVGAEIKATVAAEAALPNSDHVGLERLLEPNLATAERAHLDSCDYCARLRDSVQPTKTGIEDFVAEGLRNFAPADVTTKHRPVPVRTSSSGYRTTAVASLVTLMIGGSIGVWFGKHAELDGATLPLAVHLPEIHRIAVESTEMDERYDAVDLSISPDPDHSRPYSNAMTRSESGGSALLQKGGTVAIVESASRPEIPLMAVERSFVALEPELLKKFSESVSIASRRTAFAALAPNLNTEDSVSWWPNDPRAAANSQATNIVFTIEPGGKGRTRCSIVTFVPSGRIPLRNSRADEATLINTAMSEPATSWKHALADATRESCLDGQPEKAAQAIADFQEIADFNLYLGFFHAWQLETPSRPSMMKAMYSDQRTTRFEPEGVQ
jgi:hypothetical protein